MEQLHLNFDQPDAPPSDRRPVALHEQGIRLFACRYENHDYLWFSGHEIRKHSATLPVLHNYALTYSLADFSYWLSPSSAPRYEKDLSRMSLYATPAAPAATVTRTRLTYNAVNSRTLTTPGPRGINSPDFGQRTYLDPVWQPQVARVASGFLGYVFTFDGRVPKGVTRLGKKGAAIRVRWEELPEPRAVFREEETQPSHPINPLDVTGQVTAYDPLALPPHLLLRVAWIRDDWFVFSGCHVVHVPKRVLKRIER